MSVRTKGGPDPLAESLVDDMVQKNSTDVSNNISPRRRKRRFTEISNGSSSENALEPENIAVEEVDSGKDDFVIISKRDNINRKARNLSKASNASGSVVPSEFETVSIDSDDSDDDDGEDSEKEEIQILSETKLDKAELLRREQQFKKLTCPVCLDTPDAIVATQCGHLFCCDCIIRSLASSKTKSVHMGTCPVCRKNVRYKDLQLLSIKHRG